MVNVFYDLFIKCNEIFSLKLSENREEPNQTYYKQLYRSPTNKGDKKRKLDDS